MRLLPIRILCFMLVGVPFGSCSQHPQDMLDRAEAAYVAGDFNQALTLYDRYLEIHPTHPACADAAYWRARTLLAMDQFVPAQRGFQEARDRAGSLDLKEQAQLGYADSLYYVGEMEHALGEYEKLVDSVSPTRAPYVHFQIGLIWRSRGNESKAHAFFDNLIREYPESYEAAQASKLGAAPKHPLYYVQVGVFQVKANLNRIAVKIKDLGYPYRVDEMPGSPRHAYKLKVGGFGNVKDARKALFAIQQVSDVKGCVVRE